MEKRPTYRNNLKEIKMSSGGAAYLDAAPPELWVSYLIYFYKHVAPLGLNKFSLQIHKQHYNTHSNHQSVFNNGNGTHGQVKYRTKAGTADGFFF